MLVPWLQSRQTGSVAKELNSKMDHISDAVLPTDFILSTKVLPNNDSITSISKAFCDSLGIALLLLPIKGNSACHK